MGLDTKLRALSRSGALGSSERWLLGGSLAAMRFSALVTGVCVLVCVCVHVCHFSVSQVRHWWDCALAVFMCVFVYVFFQYHR